MTSVCEDTISSTGLLECSECHEELEISHVYRHLGACCWVQLLGREEAKLGNRSPAEVAEGGVRMTHSTLNCKTSSHLRSLCQLPSPGKKEEGRIITTIRSNVYLPCLL